MRVATRPGVLTISCTSARLLAELVNAEIAVRAKAPKPAHLLPGGVDIDLLPDGRWQARLEFEGGKKMDINCRWYKSWEEYGQRLSDCLREPYPAYAEKVGNKGEELHCSRTLHCYEEQTDILASTPPGEGQ